MKLNPQEIGKILTDHLDRLSNEEFIESVKEFCPYLFEEDDDIRDRDSEQVDRPSSSNRIKDRALHESAHLKK